MNGVPRPANDAERVSYLHSLQILDTAPEREFDDIVRIAAAICEAPTALVTIVDKERQWFKARVGLDVEETSRELSFCAHTILDDAMMEIEDATRDSRFRDNPFVKGDPQIRFYAGVPLVPENKHPVGTLCVIDSKSRKLNQRQRQSLRALGRQITVLLELRAGNQRLKQLSDQKNHFLRILGHDLRNPLSAILGAAELVEELLQSDAPREEAIELARTIPERARYMRNLINTFLDVQALEDGQIRLTRTDVSVQELFERVTDAHQEEADDADVRIAFTVPPALPRINADEARLFQVLDNLVTNALKFVPEGGTVSLSATASDREVAIEVSDTGQGIPEEDREQLFEPYAQLSSQSLRGDLSRGLGLSIAKSLIALHGGTIEVNNSAGGATFEIHLPVTRRQN